MRENTHIALIFFLFSIPISATETLIEPLMVTIPAGDFLMGSDSGGTNELPIHNVKIETFKLAKYEVTVKEFRQFVVATGYKTPQECYHQPTDKWLGKKTKGSWDNNALTNNEFQPVVCIGASAATAYARWLSQHTGKGYRLPTEAEWEYSAKAGSNTKYHLGDITQDPRICQYANVRDQTAEQRAQLDFGASYHGAKGVTECDDKSGYASIVGMYQPNAFGVYDLVGNIIEYVQDCKNDNYKGAPTDGSAWLTGDCERRVLRGGSWHWHEFSSSQRSAMPLNFIGVIEGFRLAQDMAKNETDTTSYSTIQFEKSLLNAQKEERLRRKNILPNPTKPTGLTLKQDNINRSVKLSWQANTELNVTGYNVYRSVNFGGVYKKIATGINATEFFDETPPSHKHSYVVTACNPDRFSQYSELVTTVDAVNNISDPIQAEFYNLMEGAVVGAIRTKEEKGGGLTLTGKGGINKDSWTEYLIAVKSGGFYELTYRIASPDGSDGFQLLIDNKIEATIAVPATGGFRKWKTASGGKIHLKAGKHTLRIKSIAGSWKLNWFSFKAITR